MFLGLIKSFKKLAVEKKNGQTGGGKSQKVWNYHRLLPLQFVDETQITIWSNWQFATFY